jgi:hypothetical protein
MAKRSTAVGKRQSVKKFSTPVQGPRAYVTFRKPTYGEIRITVDEVRAKTKKYLAATVRKTASVGEEAGKVESTLSETLWDIACDKFVEWNWADDEGELLGELPLFDVEDLLGEEVQTIFDIIQKLYMMSDTDEDSEGN